MTAISGVEFLIWLLIAASTIAVLTKYLRIPYTVALVLGGLLLSLLHLSFLSPLQPNQRPNWLTPDVILILFLPALVFEGSVKIDVRDLLHDAAPLLVLANIGVLLATLVTGYLVIGLPILIALLCLGINEQVAQKLHACTGPQRQDRARDILDILVVDMLGKLDRVRARAAAERTFAERKTHAFPPETIIPPEWNVELETLAAELGYRTTKAAEIQKEFTNLVAAIARGSTSVMVENGRTLIKTPRMP
jgi:Sodium/hydrogen exchanger family/Nucleotidyl transferase AbiEii toxin, Type IV TA system